ncbi:biotin--[acetyl-CoA-carboxylase] ligase [Urbifossiella limnaea]|uniref:Bifunctional ligase/repressor BirA n=1 Tax=Urbifossiella limnaea TaxID=2528023 RepID=A0A517XY51_9BACT|nr:biotin--[acetyl-CoA-carboxylase] ligase [Urbifossiella limnaea]QDU22422.1 Bifunctional ligase/repressor BirA [Urbifossiella limnaea]
MTPPAEWTFATERVGRRVLVFDELDSTNSFAAALPAGTDDGLVIVARNQTAGRGRFGRPWRSRPGAALLMSVVLTPPADLRRPVILTAWAAVAVAAAVRELAGVEARIKWPNDLLVQGKKVCGILIEQAARVVCGVGLNLAQSADEFAALGLPDATSLGLVTGSPVELRDAAGAVVRNLDAAWRRLLAGDRAAVEAAWAGGVGFVGRDVELERADGSRPTGRLRALSFDGLELERGDGTVERVPPEAVEHIRDVSASFLALPARRG